MVAVPGEGIGRGLRLVWTVLGVASFVMLVVLFLLPSTWSVERSQEIAAPRERITPLVVDLHRWSEWSPWREKDYSGLVFQYAGPPSGVGAEMSWNSEQTGDGRRRITAVDADRVTLEQQMQKGRISSTDVIALAALPGGRTRVTWSNSGTLGRTLLGRLQLGFIEDAMERDLGRALAGLAATAEGRPLPPDPVLPAGQLARPTGAASPAPSSP